MKMNKKLLLGIAGFPLIYANATLEDELKLQLKNLIGAQNKFSSIFTVANQKIEQNKTQADLQNLVKAQANTKNIIFADQLLYQEKILEQNKKDQQDMIIAHEKAERDAVEQQDKNLREAQTNAQTIIFKDQLSYQKITDQQKQSLAINTNNTQIPIKSKGSQNDLNNALNSLQKKPKSNQKSVDKTLNSIKNSFNKIPNLIKI